MKYVRKKAADSHRTWKAKVAENHLINKETGEFNKDPPKRYSYVTKQHWEKYIAYRQTPKFKVIYLRHAHWDHFIRKIYLILCSVMLTLLDTFHLKAMSKRNKANIARRGSVYYGSRGGYRLITKTIVST